MRRFTANVPHYFRTYYLSETILETLQRGMALWHDKKRTWQNCDLHFTRPTLWAEYHNCNHVGPSPRQSVAAFDALLVCTSLQRNSTAVIYGRQTDGRYEYTVAIVAANPWDVYDGEINRFVLSGFFISHRAVQQFSCHTLSCWKDRCNCHYVPGYFWAKYVGRKLGDFGLLFESGLRPDFGKIW